jgi:hypothetical protein
MHILEGQKDLKQSNATSQTHRKTRTSKSQNKQKERNNKIRAKINEIENFKKTHKESTKQKTDFLKK